MSLVVISSRSKSLPAEHSGWFRDFLNHFVDQSDKYLNDRREVLERAAALGTLHQVDRSIQYAGATYASPEALLESVNVLHNRWREREQEQAEERRRERRQMMNWKLRNGIAIALAASVGTAMGQRLAQIIFR